MKWIFCLLFLFNFSLNAQDKFIEAEGKFWANDDDNPVFIKNQLLHQGFIEVLSIELKNIGLDAQLFWQKFDQSFETSFRSQEEELAKKHGMNVKGKIEISEEKKKAYNEELRKIKLENKRNFGALEKLIRSFAVKKMTRSPQYPQSRFISIEAKVDRAALNRLYYKYTSDKQNRAFDNLYIFVDYQIKNLTWTDLGVDNKNNLVDVVNESWTKWLEQNKPENVQKLIMLNDSSIKDLDQYLAIPADELSMRKDTNYSKSLAFLCYVEMDGGGKRVASNDLNIKYKFAIVLYDLSTNSVVARSDFVTSEKSYPQEMKNQMSNLVVNYLYRIPLDDFTQIIGKIRESSIQYNLKKLTIAGTSNILDIIDFQKYLADQSVKLRLKSQLFSLNKDKTDLVVFYQGDDTILSSHLTDLKQKSKNDGFEFVFINQSSPFDIKLMPRLKRSSKNESDKEREDS
jgi:hypothetical protein